MVNQESNMIWFAFFKSSLLKMALKISTMAAWWKRDCQEVRVGAEAPLRRQRKESR